MDHILWIPAHFHHKVITRKCCGFTFLISVSLGTYMSRLNITALFYQRRLIIPFCILSFGHPGNPATILFVPEGQTVYHREPWITVGEVEDCPFIDACVTFLDSWRIQKHASIPQCHLERVAFKHCGCKFLIVHTNGRFVCMHVSILSLSLSLSVGMAVRFGH